jgi:hypothetical protein
VSRGEGTSPSGTDGPRTGFSRRQFVAGGFGAATASALLAPAAAGDEEEGLWLAGRLVAVTGEDRCLVESETAEGQAPVEVRLAQGAEVLREAPARLADFAAGEEVTARGDWESGAWAASSFQLSYRVTEGMVRRRVDDTLVVDGTVVALAGAAPVGDSATGWTAKPLGEIRAGNYVWITGRLDPATGTMAASVVSVKGR